jgi:hypothetical protein
MRPFPSLRRLRSGQIRLIPLIDRTFAPLFIGYIDDNECIGNRIPLLPDIYVTFQRDPAICAPSQRFAPGFGRSAADQKYSSKCAQL